MMSDTWPARVLHAVGDQHPQLPIANVGDFGGGALYFSGRLPPALIESRWSGQMQVVDAAIDGPAPIQPDGRRYPFYPIYETADGKHMVVGSINCSSTTLFVRFTRAQV